MTTLLAMLLCATPAQSPPPDATAARRGLVNTTTQSFSGQKTFTDGGIITHGLTVDGGASVSGDLTAGGVVRLGSVVAASRPASGPGTVGALLYDLDGGAIIFNNGSQWALLAPSSYASLPMIPTSSPTAPASGSNVIVYNVPDGGATPGQIANLDAVLGFSVPTNAIPVGTSDVIPCRYSMPNGTGLTTTSSHGVIGTVGGSQQTTTWASTNLFTRTPHFQFSTGGGSNSGWTGTRAATHHAWRGDAAGRGGFFFWTRVNIDSTVGTQRTFFGLKNSVSAISAAADPNAVLDAVYFGSNSADSNLSICANDNVTTATCTDLGASFPTKTQGAAYDLFIWAQPGASSIGYAISRLDSAASTYGTISSDLPRNTVPLGYDVFMANGATASISRLWFAGVVVCSNL